MAFPDVLARRNEDVEWTTDLGNAFLAQEADVLAAVQRMRSRARASGKLSSTREQTVTTVEQEGAEAIEITPADEQVVYVPEYDPADIWGEPLASAYPPLDYVPGYAFGPAVDVGFWFGPWAGWGWGWAWGWGWGPSWHGGSVYCNGAFFRHHGYRGYRGHEGNDGHGGHGGPPGHGPSGHLAWSHDPGHRMGVPYPNGRLAGRYQAVSMASRATPPALEIAFSLGLLELGAEVFDLFRHLLRLADLLLFLEPPGLELRRVFLDVGELFFELRKPFFAGGVLFLFERLALHLELHDLAFELIDLGRHRFQFDFEP